MKKFLTLFRLPSNGPIARLWFAPQLYFCVPLVFLFLFSLELRIDAQARAEQAADRSAIVRACPALADSKRARKEKGKRKGVVELNDAPPACLEAKAAPLDLQEFLQSFVREQKWAVGKERVSEDSWTFFRSLDKDELQRYVEVGPFAGRVTWTEGRAFIKVNTNEAEGGYTRILISARFEGHGQNADTFAPPQDTWQLASNGALEKTLISALETHFQSMH